MSHFDTSNDLARTASPWAGGAKSTASKRGPRGTAHTAKKNVARCRHVTWPAVFFAELQKKLAQQCDYGDLTAADSNTPRYQQFSEIVARCNHDHQTHVPLSAALAMRAPINIDRAAKSHMLMLKDINDITQRYLAGEDIVNIAKEKCYPPAGVFRRVLLHRGMSELTVKSLVGRLPTSEHPLCRHLCSRDIEQLHAAWNADAVSPAVIVRRTSEAAKAEAEFVEWFKTQGVKFKTQAELTAEQTAEFGRPMITPDVLILGDYRVDGIQLHWIDFKDYIGCPTYQILQSCKEQAAKYTEKWGQGAFCFHGGYIENMKISLAGLRPDPRLLANKDPLLLAYV